MKITIINGSPRKSGNTSKMCDSFARGIKKINPNAEIESIFLYDLSFKGCISCFSCKLKGGISYGKCALHDDLTSVLQKASNSDILVLASPIYLMDVSGEMKSFLERLCYSYGSYETGYRSLAPKKIKTVTIYTMNNLPEYAPNGAMDNIDMFVGHIFTPPTRICAYNTYQFHDYSKYLVEVFSESEKNGYKEKTFPKELLTAFNVGKELAYNFLNPNID